VSIEVATAVVGVEGNCNPALSELRHDEPVNSMKMDVAGLRAHAAQPDSPRLWWEIIIFLIKEEGKKKKRREGGSDMAGGH